MEKEQELAQMESRLNTEWQLILDECLKDRTTFLAMEMACSLVVKLAEKQLGILAAPANRMIAWSMIKLIMEARRRDLLPEQRRF